MKFVHRSKGECGKSEARPELAVRPQRCQSEPGLDVGQCHVWQDIAITTKSMQYTVMIVADDGSC